jgi:hypothetical protein
MFVAKTVGLQETEVNTGFKYHRRGPGILRTPNEKLCYTKSVRYVV